MKGTATTRFPNGELEAIDTPGWWTSGFVFWILLAVYAAARVLQVYPSGVPMLVVVALHVFPPAVFTLTHGARFYGWRGILAFVIISVGVGNVLENVGVRTGFPYGRYYFTNLMGPKIFAVPIMLGVAYAGMAYISWTLCRLILGDFRFPLARTQVLTRPLVAAFIMVAWDFSMDPVWSTILRAWVFPTGGAYFGIPVSNFAGWYLTIFLIYLLFTVYLRARPAHPMPLKVGYWRQAVVFYAVSAAGNLLLLLPQNRFTLVTEASGVQWKVRDITATCALVTVFTMGAFALLAWVRLADQRGES